MNKALSATPRQKKLSLVDLFCFSAGLLLIMTGLAKGISTFGHPHSLSKVDPILHLDYRTIFYVLFVVEVAIGGFCLMANQLGLKVCLIASLATNFLLYRIAALVLGVHLCPCLGSLTEELPINGTVLNILMWVVVAYLLLGSYASIFTFFKGGLKEEGPTLMHELPSQPQESQLCS